MGNLSHISCLKTAPKQFLMSLLSYDPESCWQFVLIFFICYPDLLAFLYI